MPGSTRTFSTPARTRTGHTRSRNCAAAKSVPSEVPFFFQKGQRADLVKLNVSFQGDKGSLWVKDVELLKAPLP